MKPGQVTVSGKSLEEPSAWYGPVVMSTQGQLRHAFEELREGTFLDSNASGRAVHSRGLVTGESMDTSRENRERCQTRTSHASSSSAEVVGVDPHARVVFTREGTVLYDYLVLATGIGYNYLGHEEWKALAPGLASVNDADRIRSNILTASESAEQLAASGKADAPILDELLAFVQVGAGTAGVEMAGTMAEMARMALAEDFHHIDPRSAHILLFEAFSGECSHCTITDGIGHNLPQEAPKDFAKALVEVASY